MTALQEMPSPHPEERVTLVPPLQPEVSDVFLLTRITRSPGLHRQDQYPAGVYLSRDYAEAVAVLEAAKGGHDSPLSWSPVSDRAWEAAVSADDRFAYVFEIRRFTLNAYPVAPEDELPVFPGHVRPHEDGDCTCF